LSSEQFLGKMVGLEARDNSRGSFNSNENSMFAALSFNDLHDFKEDFTFPEDENLIEIDEFTTKELEKEQA
jgi:hypothetical protein